MVHGPWSRLAPEREQDSQKCRDDAGDGTDTEHKDADREGEFHLT